MRSVLEKPNDFKTNTSWQRRAFSAAMAGITGNPLGHVDDGLGMNSLREASLGVRSAMGYMFGGLNVFQDGGGVLGAAASGPYHAAGDYRSWRRGAAEHMTEMRRAGDIVGADENFKKLIEHSAKNKIELTPLQKQKASFLKYAVQENGYRKLGARTAGDHFRKGAHNFMRYSVLSPTAWGLNAAFAGVMASDNLFDAKDGIAKHFVSSVASEVGMTFGSSIGAAAAIAAVPTGGAIAAGVGVVAGGIGGLMLGAAAIEGVVALSGWGNRNGRHGRPFRANFADSTTAATIRQRAVQSVNRSMMSARSSLGSEAMSLHG